MSAEVICVGTELLLGDIVNTNSQYLALELAQLGIPHYFQSVVGDNIERIHTLLDLACQRSQILIFTGGLGPTPDDLTTAAIASYFQTPLIEHPQILADISAKFAQRGRQMTANNRKQALLPEGAEVLPNPSGTAPGIIWQPRGDLTILTFPGVPSEMKRMWQETAVPYLRAQGWGKAVIHSQTLRFRGIGESTLASKVNHLFELENPTVAPYASNGEVRLRISAKADSVTQAQSLIEPVVTEIKAIAGLDYFGSDDSTLPGVVGQLLQQKHQTLSVAESCTAGGLGAMITTAPGSSNYFMGGIVAYDNRIKTEFLGVESSVLIEVGAVSEVVARQMATGVKEKYKTDWGIGVTGIAGPSNDGSGKPVGLVWIAWINPEDKVISREFRYGEQRSRETIRYLSACDALDGLRRLLSRNIL